MKLINNIKIKEHAVLKPIEIRDLSQINVVCGKNNSGKTLLLNHVFTDIKKLNIGIKFDRSVQDYFFEAVQAKLKDKITNLRLIEGIKNSFADLFSTGVVVYIDEKGRYEDQLNRRISNITNGDGRITVQVMSVFNSILLNEIRIAFIPSKREILGDFFVSTREQINSRGSGIANNLFRMKNSHDHEAVIYSKIKNSFSEISEGNTFDFSPDAVENNRFKIVFGNAQVGLFDADSSGMGYRDLLNITYHMHCGLYDILLIDEPENHLHPEMQRRLIRELAVKKDIQIFLATHSNVFISDTAVGSHLVSQKDGKNIQVKNASSLAGILTEVGYSIVDNLVSDLVILVEGPVDAAFLEEIFKKVPQLLGHKIGFLPLGGDIMSQVDLSVIRQGNKVCALIDRDPGSSKVRDEFEKKCKDIGIKSYKLERYSIESYIPLEIIKEVFRDGDFSNIKEIDVNKKIDDQFPFSIKGKRNMVKMASLMKINDIMETDFKKFIEMIGAEFAK